MSKTRRPMPAGLMWRYSLSWGLPYKSCPGAFELVAAEVPPGQPCPEAVTALWKPGVGYVVSIDFQQPEAAMRCWSKEAKARVRQRNLAARSQRQAPLFANERFSRETARRPPYCAGESLQHTGWSDDAR